MSNLTDNEADEVKDLAERLSKFVNGNSDAAVRALGVAMTHDHRTLIQAKARIMASFLMQLKEDHGNNFSDLRNEACCRWATKAIALAGEPLFPFI